MENHIKDKRKEEIYIKVDSVQTILITNTQKLIQEAHTRIELNEVIMRGSTYITDAPNQIIKRGSTYSNVHHTMMVPFLVLSKNSNQC